MSENILKFSMNRCTTVERMDDNTLRSVSRLSDTFTCASAEIVARLPDLEILTARAQFHHEWLKPPDLEDILRKLPGMRIGPGMLKIIKGLVGEKDESRQIGYMVEECCQAIIISLTKDILAQAPESEEQKLEFFSGMVRENIRLYNRCAAFAPGSRLVEGTGPPQ
ncbi:MAG: hypothetical protein P4L43_09485 [Syntrophobacteraceae bacterium]|nr:hypothetical protein [Syntrophobacteraceae bacterium]